MEFLLQEEVSISCLEEETKLITERVGQERLTRLSSVKGSPFPFINRGKMIDKMGTEAQSKNPLMLESRENPYRAPTRSKKEKTMVQGKSIHSCRKCQISKRKSRGR